MNIVSQNDTITWRTKLFFLASKNYGAPYCGATDKDDVLVDMSRFWISGVGVCIVGLAGNCSLVARDLKKTIICIFFCK